MRVSDTRTPFLAIGAFPDERAARLAVGELRARGVNEGTISIASNASVGAPPPELPMMSRVFWSGLIWSVIGALVGGAAGLVIGLFGVGVPGTSNNVAIQVAAWAMFVHILGAFVGCYLALDTGDRFVRKADHHDATATLIRVRASDAPSAIEAERIMRDAGAFSVEQTAPQPHVAGNGNV